MSRDTYTRRAALAMLGISGALAASSSAGYSALTTNRALGLTVSASSSAIKVTDRNGNEPGDSLFGNYNPKADRGTTYLTLSNNFSFDVSVGAANSNVTVSETTVPAETSVDVKLTHTESSDQDTELEFSDGSQTVSPYPNIDIPTAPSSGAARWTMDTSSVLDAWGSNDGSLAEGTAGQTGLAGYNSGSSTDFTEDAEEKGARVSYYPDFSTTQTLSCWFNADTLDTGWMIAIYERDGGGDDERVFEFRPRTDNTLEVYIKDSTVTGQEEYDIHIGSISANTTYHLAITYNDSTEAINYYIDGSNVRSSTMAPHGGAIGSRQNMDLGIGARRIINSGSAEWSGNFDGQIDDVRFYNKELTDSEVESLYNTGSI